MHDINYGFVITDIRCSGCGFTGKRHRAGVGRVLGRDLDKFASLKEALFEPIVAAHTKYREPCENGELRITYSNAVTIKPFAKSK